MIYRATHPQSLVEGRPGVSMSVRGPSLNLSEMPPQFQLDPSIIKSRRSILEQGTTYEQINANAQLMRKERPHNHMMHGVHPGKISNLQPFTAPWLTEVARMTPVRHLDPHLPFHTSTDMFSRIHGGITPRTPMYNPTFLPPPQSYLPDYGHSTRHPYKGGLHPSDLKRKTSTSIDPTYSGSIPHAQPLTSRIGLPIRNTHDLRVPLDFREQRRHNNSYRSIISNSSPIESEEPSPKRRLIRFSDPNSPSETNSSMPLQRSEVEETKSKSSPKPNYQPVHGSERNESPTAHAQSRPSSPFHSHFQKGSFVSLPHGIQKVEDMRTKDFTDATDASSTLKIDPSKVDQITAKDDNVSVITFSFASTKTKISVDASNSHPFFVFHRGWSSCNPHRTEEKYGLNTYQLRSGDVCISLKKVEVVEETMMPPPKAPIKCSSSTFKAEVKSPTATVTPEGDDVSINDRKDLTFQPNFPLSVTRPGVKSSADQVTRRVSRGRKRRWSDPGH